MKLKSYSLILASCLLFISQLSYSQTIATRRIAVYAQNNTSALPAAQFSNMTHYVYAFFNPMSTTGDMTDATGTPNATEGASVWFNTGTFTTRIAAARTANPNIKIIISVGGAPASDAGITTRLNTIFGAAGTRNVMAGDLALFVQKYDLDGVDLDLEHPVTQTEKDNHALFLHQMKVQLDALEATMCKDLELSIALNGETDHFVLTPTGSDYVNPSVNTDVDYYHLMTYDASYTTHNSINSAWPLNHSPLIHAQEAVRDFSSPPFSWPKSKMCVGIPFYGKIGANGGGGTQLYSAMGGTAAIYNSVTDVSPGGYNYNACPTIQNKVNFAKTNGLAGVVIWEGSQDLTGAVSLTGCAYTAMTAGAQPERTCCQKPALGNDKSVCNTAFPITLNSGTTVGSGTYIWKRIAPTSATLSAAFTNTATVTAADGAGTYVVIRNETIGGKACSRSDTIDIAATLPAPTFSPSTVSTSCAASYLLTPTNLTDFPAGTTFQWQFNAANISGETSSSVWAATPGSYTLVASLGGCTNSSASVTVNSGISTAVPHDQCSTTSPTTFNLTVTGGTGPFNWYNQDIPLGNILTGGANTATYNTGPLTTGTYYYYVEDVGAATNYSIGIPSSSPPTGFANWTTDPPTYLMGAPGPNISMEFTVSAYVTIKSVDVWPYQDVPGGRPFPYPFQVQIYSDNNNNVFTSANQTAASGAWMTVPLGASLAPGTYRMRAIRNGGTIPGFFHQTASVFPYTGGPGKISITRQIGVAQYGPFYNWQIADYGNCPRIIVRAVVAASCTGVLLPVNIISFNATKNENAVLLNWSTSNEVNNDHYNIERSVDGINFTSIGSVAGSGTTNAVQQYYFTDTDAPKSVVYYRLAQYDIDGKVNYSEVKVIDNKKGFELTIAPNPFTNNTSVSIKGATSAVDLRIYDVNGRLVETLSNNGKDASVTIGNNLNPGFYILEAVSNSAITQYKFIKE